MPHTLPFSVSLAFRPWIQFRCIFAIHHWAQRLTKSRPRRNLRAAARPAHGRADDSLASRSEPRPRSMSARRTPAGVPRSALETLFPSSCSCRRIFSSSSSQVDTGRKLAARARCRRRDQWCAPFSPHPPRPRGPATASRLAADLTPCAVVRAPQVPGSTGSSSSGARGGCPRPGQVLRRQNLR